MEAEPHAGDQEASKEGLERKILLCIDEREHRIVVGRVAVFASLFAASLFITVYSLIDAISEASHSGFFSFISLLVTDFSATLLNFSDFVFSLAESFPVFAVIFLFAGIFFVIWSLGHLLEELSFTHDRTFSGLLR